VIPPPTSPVRVARVSGAFFSSRFASVETNYSSKRGDGAIDTRLQHLLKLWALFFGFKFQL
jgi:hypothetical protein